MNKEEHNEGVGSEAGEEEGSLFNPFEASK